MTSGKSFANTDINSEWNMTNVDGRLMTTAILCIYVLCVQAPGFLQMALAKPGSSQMDAG